MARGEHGEQQSAAAVADQEGALGDDPQQRAAEHEEVAVAEDVGEGRHAGALEDGRDDRERAAQGEQDGDVGAGDRHDGHAARAQEVADDQDAAGGEPVGDPGEQGAADEVRQEAEREGQRAEQGRAGEVVDEDGEGDLADDDAEEGEGVRGEDRAELGYAQDAGVAAGSVRGRGFVVGHGGSVIVTRRAA